MYDAVLLPTDGSTGSARAATHAIELAERYGARLHALAVVESGSSIPLLDRGDEDPAWAEHALERVAELAEQRGLDAPVTEVRRGSPAEAIVDYAADAGIDAIVMGTHGRTGIDRALIGSVAERVVRRADVPVLTVALDDEPVVGSAEAAIDVAREKLEREGHGDATFPLQPSPQNSAWVVRAVADGRTYNVHVDRSAGTAHLVEIGDATAADAE